MKVYLIKRLTDNKYYLKKGRWNTKIFCESYFTERAAKWHRKYWIKYSKWYTKDPVVPEDIIIEEYEMIKL